MERTVMSSAREGVKEKPLATPTAGRSLPIGAALVSGGANFSVFSRSAEWIELLFFDGDDTRRSSILDPIKKQQLDPLRTSRED